MSTILGPLVNGLRIRFKVDFDMPADVTNLSEISITDTLPNGISWYSTTNADHKNAMEIGTTPLILGTDYTISEVSPDVIFTLTAAGIAKLAASSTLAAYIDTYISDASLIDKTVGATNTASAQYKDNGTLNQGEISEVINIEGSPISYVSPDYAPKDPNQQLMIELAFKAGSSIDPSLKYIVTADLGTNLVLDPDAQNKITAMYEDEDSSTGPIHDLTYTNDGSVYTITIPNTAGYLANKDITLWIKTKPVYGSTVPQTIDFKYNLTLGQASADLITKQIIVSGTFTLRKSVITI